MGVLQQPELLPYRFPTVRAARSGRLFAHQPARFVVLKFICSWCW